MDHYSSRTSLSFLNSSATRCGGATRSCIGTGSRLLRLPPALLEDDEREEHGVEHRRKLGVHAQAQALREPLPRPRRVRDDVFGGCVNELVVRQVTMNGSPRMLAPYYYHAPETPSTAPSSDRSSRSAPRRCGCYSMRSTLKGVDSRGCSNGTYPDKTCFFGSQSESLHVWPFTVT